MPGPIGTPTYCFCPDHINGAERRYPGHSFRLERDVPTDRHRWRCTCGSTGQWQADPRANPPYHLWLTHLQANGITP